MEEETGFEQKKAIFNSTLAILIRVDTQWKEAHRHCKTGAYEKWNIDLDRIFVEFYADCDEEQIKNFEEFNKKIAAIGFSRDKEFQKLLNKHKLYPLLMEKEFFLKKVEQKQGKGVEYQESIEDYMD